MNACLSHFEIIVGGWKIGVGVTFGIVALVVIAVGTFFMLKKYKPE